MLVFSLAEITKSVAAKALPSQVRAYRSNMRPALSAKLGARGQPGAETPGLNGILAEPSPECRSTDAGDNTLLD
jgi:hypothetical protein